MQVFFRGLIDEEDEVKSNAAYGIGVLFEGTKENVAIHIPQTLQLLHPLFGGDKNTNMQDNACGAVCRLISAQSGSIPLDHVIPVILSSLPLAHDEEEYTAVFKALLPLLQQGNPLLVEALPKLLSLFATVLKKDILKSKTKNSIVDFLKNFHSSNPEQFNGSLGMLSPSDSQILAQIINLR
jgi:hypothetical protein